MLKETINTLLLLKHKLDKTNKQEIDAMNTCQAGIEFYKQFLGKRGASEARWRMDQEYITGLYRAGKQHATVAAIDSINEILANE